MNIQYNSDNHMSIHEGYEAKLDELLKKELDRFSERITRVEVHLSDENGPKGGQEDRRCLLEVRLAGMNPIAVTETGATHDKAIKGAIDKLKSTLSSVIGKQQQH